MKRFKKGLRKLIKIAWRALLVYLIFAVIGSTAPYIAQPAVSEENIAALAGLRYESAEQGPDRALLVESPADAFSVRMGLIQNAEHTLDIVYHTIGDGITSRALLGELWRAAERGVLVRILLDGKVGASGDEAKLLAALERHPNIEYRRFSPVNALKPWDWHVLLHDKFIIADGQYLLLGGRNIGDKYFAPASYTGEVTQDRDVLIWDTKAAGDSVLPQAQSYMGLLWDHPETARRAPRESSAAPTAVLEAIAAAEQLKASDPQYFQKTLGDYLASALSTDQVTLLYNPLDTECSQPLVGYQIREMALAASQSVVIQTPYMTANPLILKALGDAAKNVDVTVVTNSTASSPNFPAFSNYISQRGKFVDTGVFIYEYQSEDSIHGKSVLIDSHLSVVGSLNLDDRSLYIDTESMLVIDSEPFAAQLGAAIGAYRSGALLVGADNQYISDPNVAEAPVSGFKEFMMRFVSLFSRPLRFLI